MLTKKDFKAVAKILADTEEWLDKSDEDSSAQGDYGGYDTLIRIQHYLVLAFAASNPRFNKAKFLKAANVNHDRN